MTSPRAGSRRSRAAAWGLGGASALAFCALVLLAPWQQDAGDAFAHVVTNATLLMFAALGTLLALRRPDNAIGWLLSVGALTWLANEGADVAVTRALVSGEAVTTPVALTAVFSEYVWPLGVLCSAALPLLLFPDGRVRSARWRWALRAMVGGTVLTMLSTAVHPARVPNSVDPSTPIANPLGVERLELTAGIGLLTGETALIVAALAAVLGVVVRLRSANGVERQQLRWITTGAVMAITGVVVFPLTSLLGWPEQVATWVFSLGFTCLPLTFTVAILRYRLYDLERIITRTVTYSALTGLLVATYALLVTAVSRLTPSGSSLAVAASTLAVAALFQPLRRRIQSGVDRRFNRTRYDAARTVEQFRLRLRDEVDLDAVRTDLLDVVHEAVQPETADLWLRVRATAGRPPRVPDAAGAA